MPATRRRSDRAAEAEEAVQEIQRERAAVLRDIEARLGPERYARLRAIGGVGLLGESLDCGEAEPRSVPTGTTLEPP